LCLQGFFFPFRLLASVVDLHSRFRHILKIFSNMKQVHLSYVGATLLSIFAPEVAAFPGVLEAATRAKADRHIVGRQEAPDLNPTFNEKLQHVSTTGEHAFVAPNLAAGDQRGPCPGLNAMGMCINFHNFKKSTKKLTIGKANHGYLPHNGVGSHTDFIKGTFDGEHP